jgi:hypothetical protein
MFRINAESMMNVVISRGAGLKRRQMMDRKSNI